MAVFPDRIVLKNSTDSQAAIEAAIGAGGADEITQGEVVVGLESTNVSLYTKASDGSIVRISSSSGGRAIVSNDAPTLGLDGQALVEGDLWYESDTGSYYVYYNSAWVEISGGAQYLNDLTNVTVPPILDVTWLLNFEYANGTTSGMSNEGDIAYSTFLFNSSLVTTSVAKFGSGSINLTSGFAFLSTDTLTTAEAESLAFGTGDFTVEQWVYWPTIPTGSKHVVSRYAQSTATEPWYIHWNGVDTVFDVRVGSTNHSTSTVSPSINTWHHVAMSRASGVVRVFFDGVEILSAANTDDVIDSTSYDLVLGGGLNIGQNLGGYMDGFRLIKGTAVYTEAFTPPTSAPTGSTGPEDGQVLAWVEANSQWEPTTLAGHTDAVESVNGATGAVVLDLDDINNVVYTEETAYTGLINSTGSSTSTSSITNAGDWMVPASVNDLLFHQDNGTDMSVLQVNDVVTFEAYGLSHTTTIVTAPAYSASNYWSMQFVPGFSSDWKGPTMPAGQGLTIISPRFTTVTLEPVDGEVLTWVAASSEWQPVAPTPLRTAAETRTLLGIGEYSSDAAAGTGGVASGAMYYNTTSSDYRLKS